MQLLTSLSKELPKTQPTDSSIYTPDKDGIQIVPTSKRIFCNQFHGCQKIHASKRLPLKQRLRGLHRRYSGTGRRFTKRFLYPSYPSSDRMIPCSSPQCQQPIRSDIDRLQSLRSAADPIAALIKGLRERASRRHQVRPIEIPITERPWERMKRFFAGGFDNDMQGLMDSIHRYHCFLYFIFVVICLMFCCYLRPTHDFVQSVFTFEETT